MAERRIPNFHFQVEWGGTRIGFEEVRNLAMGVKVIEYRDGLSPEYQTQKIPGRSYYENIILMRGVVKGDNDFFNWFSTVQRLHPERRDITIALLNEEHNPIVVWMVKNAFPVRLSWSDLNSTGNDALIESLEITHEGLRVEYSD